MCANGQPALPNIWDENALQRQKIDLLSGRSITNSQLAIPFLVLQITTSNFCVIVSKHLSAYLIVQASRRPINTRLSGLERSASILAGGTGFGLPRNASNVCKGIDKQITKAFFRRPQKGKTDRAKSRMHCVRSTVLKPKMSVS